jgi:Flp pilus assembly pilin Flp
MLFADRGVAQPGSAPEWGSGGRAFESLRPDHRAVAVFNMFLRKTAGQGLAEYALILALIAILAITALLFLSGQINTILSTIGNKL